MEATPVDPFYSTDTKYDDAQRYRIQTEVGNTYFTVTDVSIDITLADENDPRHAQLRGDLERLCIASSKLLKHGTSHRQIAANLRAYSHRIAKMMADRLEDYIEYKKE